MKRVRFRSVGTVGVTAASLAVVLAVTSVAFAAPVGGIVSGVPRWEPESKVAQWLYGVSHASTTTAWAVGAEGTIISTTDGGENWVLQAVGPGTRLSAVAAASESTVVAVGDGANIHLSNDGGQTWLKRPVAGTTSNLRAVDFGTGGIGVAVGDGGTIVRTDDGGVTWAAVAGSPTAQTLFGVAMADNQRGWAVGAGGTILRTLDGGLTWDATQNLSGDVDLYAVSAIDRTTAWASGDQGRIAMTTDGGRTWVVVHTGVPVTLQSIDFTNRNLGWAAGAGGTILRTVDGGRSWRSVNSSTTAQFQSVDFSADGSVGHAVGENGMVDRVRFEDAPGTVIRAAGADRYAAAAAMARRGWDSANTRTWTNVNHVIVVNGETGKEADLLSAVGLAGAYDAPILPIKATSVPAATKTLITEIAARRQIDGKRLYVHIVGGTASVPDARWNEIRTIPGVSSARDRLAGADRYAVSAAVANRIVTLKGASDVQGVILVAADNPAAYYDALAASPIAYGNVIPILAVKKTGIPATVNAVLNGALAGKPVYAASSATYIAWVPPRTERLATSASRFTAATQVANQAIARGWLRETNTGIAASMADALSGGAFLGERGGVLLYTTPTTTMHSSAAAFIAANGKRIDNGWVLGGIASVPAAQESSFRAQVQ